MNQEQTVTALILLALMKNLKASRAGLARYFHVNPSSVFAWTENYYEPSLASCMKIKEVTNFNLIRAYDMTVSAGGKEAILGDLSKLAPFDPRELSDKRLKFPKKRYPRLTNLPEN
ncbi:MAG: hypothetical protein K6B65_01925 [Bacilli bacterium]|nr:hypothetical protein [Bacilli bacterium]